MKAPILVRDWDGSGLASLGKAPLVLSVDSLASLRDAVRAAEGNGNPIRCLVLRTPAPLSELGDARDLAQLPIALHPGGIGELRRVVRMLPALRDMNLRVYFDGGTEKACTEARVLASLGIETAVCLRCEAANPGLLSDLAAYALLGLVQHASIEPFEYIAANYVPQGRTDFRAVYFDDPETYLHVDAQGRVALTRDELGAGVFIADSVGALTETAREAALAERRNEWRRAFIERDRCASCQAWRICMGNGDKVGAGCSGFFVELMDIVDRRRASTGRSRQVWRP
jgi:radical SAM protein with 4Fe4S-binding SPASM domain